MRIENLKTGLLTTAAGLTGDVVIANFLNQDASGLNPSRVPTDIAELFTTAVVTGIGVVILAKGVIHSRRRQS